MRNLKKVKTGYIISSVILVLLGLFIMLKPELSIKAVCLLTGIVLIICGAFKIIGYFSKDLYALAFQHDLAFGVLAVVVGIIIAVHPKAVMSAIYFFFGITMLIDGLIKIQTAIEAKRFGLAKWPVIALGAAAAGVLGILLILNPFGGAEAVTSFFGFCLIAEGALNIIVGVYTIKILDKKFIDADYTEKF